MELAQYANAWVCLLSNATFLSLITKVFQMNSIVLSSGDWVGSMSNKIQSGKPSKLGVSHKNSSRSLFSHFVWMAALSYTNMSYGRIQQVKIASLMNNLKDKISWLSCPVIFENGVNSRWWRKKVKISTQCYFLLYKNLVLTNCVHHGLLFC